MEALVRGANVSTFLHDHACLKRGRSRLLWKFTGRRCQHEHLLHDYGVPETATLKAAHALTWLDSATCT
jgi:hypothetical protein